MNGSIVITGFLRFGVVTRDYQAFRKINGKSLEDRLAIILDPDRIANRLALLEAMPLASLAAQTDKEFRLGIYVSTRLDKQSRLALDRVAARYSFVEVLSVDPEQDFLNCARMSLDPARVNLSFRIDDDDAINSDFIAELRAIATRDRIGHVFALPSGIHLERRGKWLVVTTARDSTIALGLAHLAAGARTIFDLGDHSKIDHFPIHYHPKPRAWIRTIHGGSISGTRRSSGAAKWLHPSHVAYHLQEYRVDFERVHALLAPMWPDGWWRSPNFLASFVGRKIGRLGQRWRST